MIGKKIQDKGVAEIIVTSIDRDGTGEGFDLDIVKILKKHVNIPYILNGGFSKLKHLRSSKFGYNLVLQLDQCFTIII